VIAILLSTCNGAPWLPALLDSIHRQTHEDWQLLARDDGSADATPRVLTVAASRDRRILPLRDWAGPQGVTGSFALLMRRAAAMPARYFAFADQDDVWMTDKLARQLAALRELESRHGPDVPLLVHTDLRIIDADRRELHPSLTRYLGQGRSCQCSSPLRPLLAHNIVRGCAALFNRPLLEAASPLPAEAVAHDWWLALCAAAAGQVRYLPEATVHYRLHGGNVRSRIGSRLRLRRWVQAHRHLAAGAAQARALAERLRERGQPAAGEALRTLDQYASFFGHARSRLRRSWGVCRTGVGRPGPLHRLSFAGAAALARLPVASAAGPLGATLEAPGSRHEPTRRAA
jgi:glycosyltransferase involved in cell wall biosynthesis